MFVIDIAKDFSRIPHGRYHSDILGNAEALFILIQDVSDYEDSVVVTSDNDWVISRYEGYLSHLES